MLRSFSRVWKGLARYPDPVHTTRHGKYVGDEMRSHQSTQIARATVQLVRWSLCKPAWHAAAAKRDAVRGAKKIGACMAPGGLLEEASL
jgi:hypothetical protein